ATHLRPAAKFWGDFTVTALVTLVAIALDARSGWLARSSAPDLIVLREEQRLYAAEAIAAALEAHDIPVHLRNFHHRTLWQFFGSFIPIEICVRAEHREQAEEVLDEE